jgi:hypothetical protein
MKSRRHGLKKRSHKTIVLVLFLTTALLTATAFTNHSTSQITRRPRAREAGVQVGILPVGPFNAITDVTGVTVGHTKMLLAVLRSLIMIQCRRFSLR